MQAREEDSPSGESLVTDLRRQRNSEDKKNLPRNRGRFLSFALSLYKGDSVTSNVRFAGYQKKRALSIEDESPIVRFYNLDSMDYLILKSIYWKNV